MGLAEQLRFTLEAIVEELVRSENLPAEVRGLAFSVERPKRPEHGDLATNIALVLAKPAKTAPREIASKVAAKLGEMPKVKSVEIAGPGFLNIRFEEEAFQAILGEVLSQGRGYGRAPSGVGERILIEFVSANPTGPLLVSHGRGAITGDAIARLLEAAGHRVTREYYINDFGNQVRLLGLSAIAAAKGEPPPEGGYGGGYMRDLASWLNENAKAEIEAEDQDAVSRLSVTRMLDGVPGSSELPGIKNSLKDLSIEFDAWYSEESLHRWGKVSAALDKLREQGKKQDRSFLERDETGALFFMSTKVSKDDDKDRVVQRGDGRYTYFASDIAYHADKIDRGYDRLINVLGADHHGYVPRVRNAISALGLEVDRFEVVLYQLVSLLREGKPVKMGKRLGNLITIDEVIEEIDQAAGRKGAGSDALRYYYLVRRSDSPIELDIEIAKKSSLDNPVFYLQYGHARLCAILRRAKSVFGLEVPRYSESLQKRLVHPDELDILGKLGAYPQVLQEAASERAPHRVLFYLQDLAQAFQSYYTRLKNEKDPILPLSTEMTEGWEERWDREKTEARLLWIEAIRTVYEGGLSLLGISAPSEMVRPTQADEAEALDEDEAGEP